MEDELETEIRSNPRMCARSKYTHPFIPTDLPRARRALCAALTWPRSCAAIGSEESTRGCLFPMELQGCIRTGVRNGMGFGVCDGLPSHTKNNTQGGHFCT